MNAYNIALFVHLIAVVLAAGATAATKLATSRRIRARTVGEALEWHNTLMAASKVFPISLIIFLMSGGYMLSVARVATWSTGWIVAGLTGVVLLFASGIFLGVKGGALKRVLEQHASQGADRPAPRLVPPMVIAVLPMINTGIAISVVFDMATKPTSIPLALGIIGIGVALGFGLGLRGRRPAGTAQVADRAAA